MADRIILINPISSRNKPKKKKSDDDLVEVKCQYCKCGIGKFVVRLALTRTQGICGKCYAERNPDKCPNK